MHWYKRPMWPFPLTKTTFMEEEKLYPEYSVKKSTNLTPAGKKEFVPRFTIGVQTFSLMAMPTEEEAIWYTDMLRKAHDTYAEWLQSIISEAFSKFSNVPYETFLQLLEGQEIESIIIKTKATDHGETKQETLGDIPKAPKS